MKIENPKLILEEINRRMERAEQGKEIYKGDANSKYAYNEYARVWEALFALRRELFHSYEIYGDSKEVD